MSVYRQTTFDRMIKDGLMPMPKTIYGQRGGKPPQGKRGVMKMQVAFTTTAVATSIALIAVVSAQEPKAVKTVKVTQSLNDTALYEVKDDGTVLIDWDEVEALAASKPPCSCPKLKSCWQSVTASGKPRITRTTKAPATLLAN